jgi:hypothetical protein
MRKVQQNPMAGSRASFDGDEAMDGFLDGRKERREIRTLPLTWPRAAHNLPGQIVAIR